MNEETQGSGSPSAPLSAITAARHFGAPGFWVRAGCHAIDTAILLCGFGLLAWMLRAAGAPKTVIQLLAWTAYVSYHALFVARSGRTPGKAVGGLLVLTAKDTKVDPRAAWGRAVGRIASAFLFGTGFLMAAFTRDARALHDFIAGTRVVYEEEIPNGRKILLSALGVLSILFAIAAGLAFSLRFDDPSQTP